MDDKEGDVSEHKPHHDVKGGKHSAEHPKSEKLDHERSENVAKPALRPRIRRLDNSKLEAIVIVLAALFLIIVLFNQYQIQSIAGDIQKKASEEQAAKTPARVQMTIIEDASCAGCYDISKAVAAIKGSGRINVTSERKLGFDDSETAGIVKKYGIESLPTVVLKGDIVKAHQSLPDFSKQDDVLYLANIPPPYFEVSAGQVRGLVNLTHISDSSCAKCSSTSTFGAQLKAAGVPISSEEVVDFASPRGKELVSRYQIKSLPAITLSPGISYYPIITRAWPQLGNVAGDGTYVLRIASPPFVNVSTGQVSGIVRVTYLADKTCEKCYDPKTHGQILKQSYSMAVENETTLDISDRQGKDLIARYSITAVPTVIISSDAKYYPSFAGVWPGVGSIESDGSFIFRNFAAFAGNPYRNLTTGEVVENQG